MKKIPSALKWMAEKRARLAHELTQTSAIAAEVNERVERITADLAGLDRAIQVFDTSIDPRGIQPVAAWKGRYGKRGALRECICRHLKASGPEWLGTDNLETLVTFDLYLAFETPKERRKWLVNSFRRELKRLVEEGLAERRHDPDIEARTREMGAWRWKQEKTRTLAEFANDDRD